MTPLLWIMYGTVLVLGAAFMVWLGFTYADTHNPLCLVGLAAFTFVMLQIGSTPFRK